MKIKITVIISLLTILISTAQAIELKSTTDFGLGLASVTTGAGGNSTLITAWIPIKSTMGIQPYFGVLGTSGSFNFLAGGAFKATVAGTGSTGLHIGGDVLLGSVASTFVATFGGIFGIHFAVHQSVMLSVEGGPQLGIAGGNTDFTIQSVSSLLGLSLIYFL